MIYHRVLALVTLRPELYLRLCAAWKVSVPSVTTSNALEFSLLDADWSFLERPVTPGDVLRFLAEHHYPHLLREGAAMILGRLDNPYQSLDWLHSTDLRYIINMQHGVYPTVTEQMPREFADIFCDELHLLEEGEDEPMAPPTDPAPGAPILTDATAPVAPAAQSAPTTGATTDGDVVMGDANVRSSSLPPLQPVSDSSRAASPTSGLQDGDGVIPTPDWSLGPTMSSNWSESNPGPSGNGP